MTPEAVLQLVRLLRAGWSAAGAEKYRQIDIRALAEDLEGVNDDDGLVAAKRLRRTLKFPPANPAAAIRAEVLEARSGGRVSTDSRGAHCPDCDEGWLGLVLDGGAFCAVPCPYCADGSLRRAWLRRDRALYEARHRTPAEKVEAYCAAERVALQEYDRERGERARAA